MLVNDTNTCSTDGSCITRYTSAVLHMDMLQVLSTFSTVFATDSSRVLHNHIYSINSTYPDEHTVWFL